MYIYEIKILGIGADLFRTHGLHVCRGRFVDKVYNLRIS